MDGNWRDLFAFNKRERNGIFVLTTLISVVIIIQYLMPNFVIVKNDFEEQNIDAYLIQLRKDSAKWKAENQKKYNFNYAKPKNQLTSSKKEDEKKFNSHSFNPNEASTEDWKSVGLSIAQANSIQRYLDKGGKFKVKNDVAKMYVISPERFSAMKPFLLLPDSVVKQKNYSVKEAAKPLKRNDTIYVELNTADTTELKELHGIGSYYARQIVYYRDKLGGFYSITQLYEIENMREETVQKIEPFITVDTLLIKKLHINSDEAKVLVRHPYITWNMAKRIQDHRDFDHRFKSVNDLLKFGLLTEELYTKLVPYIVL